MLTILAAEEVIPGLAPASAGTSLVVALMAAALAVLAFRAAALRANPRLRYVGLAFVVFTLKNLFSAYNVITHTVPHDAIELVLSLFDLLLLVLLFVPFIRRQRR